MFDLTITKIRDELLKISSILTSNYQELLEKGHKNKVRNTLDDSPVNWNLDFSWVNNKKVKDLNDLTEDDWTQDRAYRDRIKNIAIEGKTKDTDTSIMFKVIWGESEGQNKYIVYQKKSDGQWDKGQVEHNLKNALKFMEKLNNPDVEDEDLGKIYKEILDKKRNEIKDHLNSLLDISYPWKLSPRSPAKKYSLDIVVPEMTSEDNSNLMDKIQKNQIDKKLINFITELSIKEGFKKDHFKFVSSFKKSSGFSILLR